MLVKFQSPSFFFFHCKKFLCLFQHLHVCSVWIRKRCTKRAGEDCKGLSHSMFVGYITTCKAPGWSLYTEHCVLSLAYNLEGKMDSYFKKYLSYNILMRASHVAQPVKNLPAMQEICVWFLSWEDLLEKEMATHSSILAWRIPWTQEPGRLQSKVLQESDMTKCFLSFFSIHDEEEKL